jgi:ABC-2 type transport system ATP-binding protein
MLLQTNHLTKFYGRFRALDDLSMSVNQGEIFGLLGPNGSGKTTVLRIVMGFLKPTSGRASISGHDSWHDGVRARRQVAYLPGELRLYENMSGRQLVRFLGQLRAQSVDSEVDRLAKRLEIDLARPIASLSSGMKRKVALLQVLMPKVPLLILDEPTNTLDPTMRHELLGQLRDARARGQTVLFSSHVLAEAEEVCDRVAILKEGRLVHLQDMSELREARLVSARFDGPVPELPDHLAGASLRSRTTQEIVLEYRGVLPTLLQWLATQRLADLRLEHLGLSAIYHRFHGEAA